MSKQLSRLMLILVCLGWTSAAHAQIRSATLTGTVIDPQKAIVPGATVVVTNEGTNVSQELVTNDAGLFTAPLLPAGTYSISVSLAGFAPFKRSGIVLNAHLLDYDQRAALVMLTVSDVTSARLAERIKDDLLKEKQVLLLELQHRVANSLQIIASVLMQSARRVQSEETRLHLRNAHRRVLSIATLQKQLAVSDDDQVQLRQYFEGLCESIGASMIDEDGKITLTSTTDGSSATANVSTSLGLIVTELVINALKHAFPNRDKAGQITVDYHAQGTGFALTVADNGVGIAASAEPTAPGLGTGIVDALAKHLGATVETSDAEPGTKVAVVRED